MKGNNAIDLGTYGSHADPVENDDTHGPSQDEVDMIRMGKAQQTKARCQGGSRQ